MTVAPGARDVSVPRSVGVGAAAGVVSGALGVGGGIILVPYLVLIEKFGQKNAQATSLVMVAMAAVSGAATYALQDSVAWLPAAFILAGSLAGAVAGSALVQRLRPHVLQMMFGILLVIVAVRLILSGEGALASQSDLPALTALVAVEYVASGLAMGLLSALFGIGGGVILIPILVALLGYGQHLAAGTSLAVMVPTALLGAIRLTKPGFTDWRVGALLGLGGIVGGLVGARVALLLPEVALKWAFALLVTVVGIRLIVLGWKARPVR